MEITMIQALLIALWVWAVQSRVFLGGATVTLRFSPLMTGLVVGVIMGDVQQAMIVTAALQIVYMGVFAPGGSMPSEPAIATAIAVPAALQGGLDPAAALAIALPIGMLGSYLQQVRFFLNSFVVQITDRAAAELNFKKFMTTSIFYPIAIAFILHVPIIFIALYAGVPQVTAAIEAIEGTVVIHILEVAAGGLAAIGIATTIYVIGKKQYIIFFLLAYFLSVVLSDLGIGMVTWAILGTLMAAIFVMSKQGQGPMPATSNSDMIDDDF